MTTTISNFGILLTAYSEELGRDVALIASHIEHLRWVEKPSGGMRLVASAQNRDYTITEGREAATLLGRSIPESLSEHLEVHGDSAARLLGIPVEIPDYLDGHETIEDWAASKTWFSR